MKRVLGALALGITTLASTARADTFATGSLIIPMDTTYQDLGMLRAYGLVYELLRNDVPVAWMIRDGKGHLGVDFVASATDVQSNAAIANHGYRGGPWVVDSLYAAQAMPIIAAWQASNPSVKVHRATASFSGDVSRRLVIAPTIGMHADGNEKIARKYLQAAGIPDSTLSIAWAATSPDMLTPAEVAGPTTSNHSDGKLFDEDGDPVYCQFMSMHWGVNEARAIPETVAEVRQFLNFETHFFAECQAVSAFENDLTNGLFVSTKGFTFGIKPAQNVDFFNDDSPFAQLDGVFESVGGSEPSFTLATGSAYKAGGIVMITERGGVAEGLNDVWMTGYLDGVCPPNSEGCGSLGKVSYLGGHEYDVDLPISTHPKTQGTRLFLNALFEAPCATTLGQPVVSVQKSAPATTTSPTVTFTIDYANNGGGIALSAMLRDTLPAGSTFVSATGGGTLASGVVSWNLHNLSAGEGGTVSFTVTLGGFGSYQNTARVDYRVGLNDFMQGSNTTTTLYDKDTDGDGVIDAIDICPNHPNPGQNLQADIDSCGQCGKICTAANGYPACNAGICGIAYCLGTHADCDGLYATGCEYAISGFQTDPNHCGNCDQHCSYQNAAALCEFWNCKRGACNAGFSDCNELPSDGCEYANPGFQTDPNHCGSCTNKCAPGFTCKTGTCSLSTCPSGFSDCNGASGDGCEYANSGFQTDLNNCGGCGLACQPAHATGACSAGSCRVGSCNSGFTDCNGLSGDGCEYATSGFQTDLANCGGCGKSCAPAHATGQCAAGTCSIKTCTAGFDDCNGVASDGCEYATSGFQTDLANCGGCGRSCAPAHATGVCGGGQCSIGVCSSGFVDRDQDPANGCEYVCTPTAANDTTCNGVDDDCNGKADDGYTPVQCGIGACVASSTCTGGNENCTPGPSAPEGPDATCADGADNDCDGQTDGADPDCAGFDAGAGGSLGAGGATDGGAGAGSGGSAGTGSGGGGTGGASSDASAGSAGTGGSSGASAGNGGSSADSGGSSGASAGNGGSSGASAGSGGSGTAGAGASVGTGGGASGSGAAAGAGGTGASAGTGGNGVAGSRNNAPNSGASAEESGGCGCRTPTRAPEGGWLALLAVLAVCLRRKRER